MFLMDFKFVIFLPMAELYILKCLLHINYICSKIAYNAGSFIMKAFMF